MIRYEKIRTMRLKMKINKRTSEKLKVVEHHFFFRIVWGPLGYVLALSLISKSKFKASNLFFEKRFDVWNYADPPLSIFHPSVRSESSPRADSLVLLSWHCQKNEWKRWCSHVLSGSYGVNRVKAYISWNVSGTDILVLLFAFFYRRPVVQLGF